MGNTLLSTANLHPYWRDVANTGIKVSPLGLGTVKLGRDQGVKYPHAFVIPDDREAMAIINLAKDLGINLIDTAPAYGNSEQRLGNLLAGQRREWVICSKVGEEFSSSNGGISHFDFTPEHCQKSVRRSLERLKTDFIDIVLIHSDGNDCEIINSYGTLEVLAELKQQGLIRAFGMSSKTVAGGTLAAQKSDIVMASYNVQYTGEKTVLDVCKQLGKACFIKKAFASGHLSKNVADPVKHSMDFVFQHPGTTSAIVGTINRRHLVDNVNAAVNSLSN